MTIMIILIMIITIIIDDSCIAEVFKSGKLNALAHTIHTNIHTAII